MGSTRPSNPSYHRLPHVTPNRLPAYRAYRLPDKTHISTRKPVNMELPLSVLESIHEQELQEAQARYALWAARHIAAYMVRLKRLGYTFRQILDHIGEDLLLETRLGVYHVHPDLVPETVKIAQELAEKAIYRRR